MADKYVSTTGSDAAAGDISHPWLTASYGFSHISSLDTLNFFAGNYAGPLDGCTLPSGVNDGSRTIVKNVVGNSVWITGFSGGISFADNTRTRAYITFDGIGVDGSSFVLFGDRPGYYVGFNSSYITLQNLTIKNCRWAVGAIQFVKGSNGNSDNCRIINCTVFNNGSLTSNPGTSDQQHGIYISGTNQLVEYCNVYNNANYGIQCYEGTPNYCDNTIIRNNRVHGNGLNPNYSNGELIAGSGNDIKVYNNVIYRDSGGLGTQYTMLQISGGTPDNLMAYNNTLYGSNSGPEYGILVIAGSTNTKVRNNIAYNIVNPYTNGGSGTTESNTLTTNPDFINAGAANFDLLVTSDAIDAGFNVLSVVTTDIIDTARPQNVIIDIGAYEYIFSITTPRNGSIVGMGFP